MNDLKVIKSLLEILTDRLAELNAQSRARHTRLCARIAELFDRRTGADRAFDDIPEWREICEKEEDTAEDGQPASTDWSAERKLLCRALLGRDDCGGLVGTVNQVLRERLDAQKRATVAETDLSHLRASLAKYATPLERQCVHIYRTYPDLICALCSQKSRALADAETHAEDCPVRLALEAVEQKNKERTRPSSEK